MIGFGKVNKFVIICTNKYYKINPYATNERVNYITSRVANAAFFVQLFARIVKQEML